MSVIIEQEIPAYSDQMLIMKDDKLVLKNGQAVTVSAVNFHSVLATEIEGHIFAIAISRLSTIDKTLVAEYNDKMNLRRTVQNTRYVEEV